jgi:hypothetical protein
MGQLSDYFESELDYMNSHLLFQADDVNQPSHYQIADGIEAIDIIEAVMAHFEFLTPMEAYLLGNFLKYRLRAGDKDDLRKDIKKSNVYRDRLRASRND